MLPKINLTLLLLFFLPALLFSQNNKLDSLYYILNKAPNNNSEIEILKQIAKELSSENNDSIEFIANKTFKYSDKIKNNKFLSKLNFTIAYSFYLKKDWVIAIKKFLSAQSFIKKNENLELESELFEYMADAYSKIGLKNKAKYYYQSSIEFEKDSLKIGIRYRKLGLLIALDLFEKLKIREVLDSKLNILNNNQEIKNTLIVLKKALAIGLNYKNQYLIEASNNTIAIIYLLTGNNDKAWDYFQQALQVNIKIKDTGSIANSYGNLAETAFRMGKYNESIGLWQKSFDYLKNIDDPFMKADHYKGLARVFYAKKDFAETLFHIEKSIEIEKNYSLNEPLAESFGIMVQIYDHTGQVKKANYYLKKQLKLKDSLLILEKIDKARSIELAYELEKAEYENKLLVKGNKLKSETLTNLKFRNNTFIIIILLLVILISFVFYTWHKIKKQKDEILQKNNVITSKNKEITQQNEEIKQQNEELKTHKENLQKQVEIRTQELEKALKKAQESDHLKASFLKNISHEVRTPMNAIMGFSQLLDYNTGDPNLKYIEIIDKHVQELLLLIEQIVELSKVQSQESNVNVSELSVYNLMKEIQVDILYLRNKLNKEHIQIHFSGENDSNIKINSDKEKLRVIFINLLENALKYTEKGDITLSYSQKKDKIIFSIVDTGIGIEENKLPFIFDSFRKIEDSSKFYRGTGLGLTLVKSFVNLLKGEIFVESEHGKGTIFTVIIPCFKN